MQQGHVPVLQTTAMLTFPHASLQQQLVPWSLLYQVLHAMLLQTHSRSELA